MMVSAKKTKNHFLERNKVNITTIFVLILIWIMAHDIYAGVRIHIEAFINSGYKGIIDYVFIDKVLVEYLTPNVINASFSIAIFICLIFIIKNIKKH